VDTAKRHEIVAGVHAPSPEQSAALAERGFRFTTAELSISPLLIRLLRDHREKEAAMKYMMLIQQVDARTGSSPEGEANSGRCAPEAGRTGV
jgi:hypothetical protein